MKIQQLVPSQEEVGLDEVLARIREHPFRALPPFAPEILQFCSSFSRRLFRDPEAKRYPELQALAFWMRRSALEELRQQFDHLKSCHTWLAPRGLVFHVPPANVDTVFVYSWLVSVLAGNRNILRISPRAAPQTSIICRVLNEGLAEAEDTVRHNTLMLSYGHDQQITAAISALADVRVIWGGDSSVNNIRSIPIPPHCKELTFPDRHSLSAICASAFLEADDKRTKELLLSFYNDVYWFDQMACSSPKLLIWCGNQEVCSRASEIFLQNLHYEARRRVSKSDASGSMNRLAFLYNSILDQPVNAAQLSPSLAVAQLENIDRLQRDNCGGGFLFQFFSETLDDVAPYLARKDQTLTYFGFSQSELMSFARLANGRGIDRIVPIGKALNFHRYWDGYDLLAEMVRHVHVEPSVKPVD